MKTMIVNVEPKVIGKSIVVVDTEDHGQVCYSTAVVLSSMFIENVYVEAPRVS